ncbi:MAG: hypothetical protein IJM22_06740 [Treponema sp.]|uniref:hypothetical protein n=1 Tax=Treponema sp. TaxID=166 RepID=UPI00298ED094|nr:hypothetical protein [Treponema sp.]MBR0155757.1 hypothetical protein [Treponema sp.]
MEFYVNSQKLDVTIQDEKTVGDVLRSFEVSCEQNKLATIGITVDGKNIGAEEFDKAIEMPLKDDTKIEVSVISESAVSASFAQSSKEMTDLIELLKNIPVEMQSGKDIKAKQTIIKLSDVMNAFCSTVTWSSLFPEKFGSIMIDGKNLSDFLSDLSPILKDFSDALENSDSVLLGDLSEYEICPRLESLSKAIGEL